MGLEVTQSGLYVPAGTLEHAREDDREAVARQYEAMSKLETHFPQLVKVAITVAKLISNYAAEKGISQHSVILGAAKWRDSGHVVVDVEVEVGAERVASKDHAVKHYGTLREVNEDFPMAVGLVMALGFRLVSAINHKRVMPASIQVSAPTWSGLGKPITFKISHGGRGLSAPRKIKL